VVEHDVLVEDEQVVSVEVTFVIQAVVHVVEDVVEQLVVEVDVQVVVVDDKTVVPQAVKNV